MPNLVATLAYLIWPFVVWFFFLKYPIKKALFVSFLSSSLLLPFLYSIDLPLVPAFDRDGLTALSILAVMIVMQKKYKLLQPGLLALYVLILSVFITALNNPDPILVANNFLPGLTLHDALGLVFGVVLTFVPYLLARHFSEKIEDTEIYLKIIVSLALVYSVPMVLEIRLSPFLHDVVYGYIPGSYGQNIRGSGFRPVVFLGHGLPLAIWFSSAVISAYTLLKNKITFSKLLSPKITFTYMLIILVLCKTLSALFYAMLGIFLLKFVKPSIIVRLTFIGALLVLCYPASKMTNFFPEESFVNFIESINVERAASLQVRLDNEAALLEKAFRRPLFGWGSWGRNRIYDQWNDISITDGFWIIQLGVYGIVGFSLYYILLITPLYYAWRNFRYIQDQKNQIYVAALAYLLFMYLLDTIPNANLMPINFFLAGALLGQAQFLKKKYMKSNSEKTRVLIDS